MQSVIKKAAFYKLATLIKGSNFDGVIDKGDDNLQFVGKKKHQTIFWSMKINNNEKALHYFVFNEDMIIKIMLLM